jgi:putative endonuclease
MRGGWRRGPTTEVGRNGEARAVAFLVDRGYAIVARNWRCRIGELDLIARDGDTLAFVEIRSRADGSRGDAIATVGAAKQRKLAQVAAAYLAAERPVARACRFDVVGLTGDDIVLIKDAFRVA